MRLRSFFSDQTLGSSTLEIEDNTSNIFQQTYHLFSSFSLVAWWILLAFFLWCSLICCDVRPEKKWENIVHRHYSSSKQRPLGSFFCNNRDHQVSEQKKARGQIQYRGCVTYVIMLLRAKIISEQHPQCSGKEIIQNRTSYWILSTYPTKHSNMK